MSWPPETRLRALVRRAAEGDREAFAALYKLTRSPIRRYLARRLAQPEAVDDLTMAVFEKLIVRLGAYDPARGSVRAFVVTVTRHTLIDDIRRRRNVRLSEAETLERLPDLGPDPEDALAAGQTQHALREAIRRAPHDVRLLLSLRYGDGLSTPEVAEALGISPAAARKRLSRALQGIRDQLQANESSTTTPSNEVKHANEPATT